MISTSQKISRTDETWFSIFVDLSLDSATSVLAMLDTPSGDLQTFKSVMQRLDPAPSLEPDVLHGMVDRVALALAGELGASRADAWMNWMAGFPCDGDNVLRAPSYWSFFSAR
jgi:hypothetical protein